MITYLAMLFKYSRTPGKTVTDIPVPASLKIDPKKPATAPPIIPITNGLINLKFTPNIAGSVIPKLADKADG